MFPDSKIAQSFSCGAAYLACFGIYLYFQEIIIEIVRFWDSEVNKITERYFNTEFLGCATAADMLLHFKSGMGELNHSCLVQVSVDGPWS